MTNHNNCETSADFLQIITVSPEGANDEHIKEVDIPTSLHSDFSLDHIPLIEEEELHQQDNLHSKDHSTQLLHWHYHLGHLPFLTLQAMAAQKLLPQALARCTVWQCATCLYAKATK